MSYTNAHQRIIVYILQQNRNTNCILRINPSSHLGSTSQEFVFSNYKGKNEHTYNVQKRRKNSVLFRKNLEPCCHAAKKGDHVTIFKLEKKQKGALQDMEGRSMKQF